MQPEETIIRDETTFTPVENSGEGEEMQVSIIRNIEKNLVETITVGEAKNKADFLSRQLATLTEQRDDYVTQYEKERDALNIEFDKYQNIIDSVTK